MPCSFAYSVVVSAFLCAEPPQLVGAVRSLDGKPVADAQVFVAVGARLGVDDSALRGGTRTSPDGTYRLPAPATNDCGERDALIAASASGYDVTLEEVGLLPAEPQTAVDLKLRPLKSWTLTVHDPAGKPLVGAEVALKTVLQGDRLGIPSALQASFTRTTDARGRIAVDFVSNERADGWTVTHPKFGVQTFSRAYMYTPAWKVLALRPVGQVRVSIDAPPGAPLDKLQLTIFSSHQSQGFRRGVVNLGGQASVAAQKSPIEAVTLAEGNVYARPSFPQDCPWYCEGIYDEAEPPKYPELKPGQELALRFRVRPGVPFKARVIEAKTNRPLVGVIGHAWTEKPNRDLQTRLKSDEQGWMRGVRPAGAWRFSIQTPDGFKLPDGPISRNGLKLDLQDAGPEVDLGAIELEPLKTLSGRVVDAEGRGVAGAKVNGDCTHTFGSGWQTRSARARTGADGRFTLNGVDGTVMLTARAGDACEAAPVAVAAAVQDATIKISPANSVYLTVKVVDRAGKPIRDPVLAVEYRVGTPDRNEFNWDRHLDFRWIAGPGGVWRSEVRVPIHYRLVAEIGASGYRTLRKFSLIPQPSMRRGAEASLADVVLRADGQYAGRAVDLNGKPISNATAKWIAAGETTRTASADANGEFSLSELRPGKGVLVVQAPGFHFAGRVVESSPTTATPFAITQVPIDRPAPKHAGPTPLDAATARALRRKILEPALIDLDKRAERERYDNLTALAVYEPDAALTLLDDVKLDTGYRAWVQRSAALALAEEKFADALDVVEAIAPGDDQLYAMRQLFKTASHATREQRLDLVARLRTKALALPSANDRLAGLTYAAEGLLALGEIDRARAVLDEAKPTVAALGSDDQNELRKEYYALALAQIDAKAATEIAKSLTHRFMRPRALGRIAARLAAKHPAEAEAAFREVSSEERHRYVQGFLYRLAGADLPRARALAEKLPEVSRGYAFGMLAAGVFDAKRDAQRGVARELLDEAYRILHGNPKRSSRWADNGTYDNAIHLALALLPVAERIAPETVSDRFWGTLAASRDADNYGAGIDSNGFNARDCNLIRFASQYEPAVADAILQPYLDALDELAKDPNSHMLMLDLNGCISVARPRDSDRWMPELEKRQKDDTARQLMRSRAASAIRHDPRKTWVRLLQYCEYFHPAPDSDDD